MQEVSENLAPNSYLAYERSPCQSSIICQGSEKNLYSDASIPVNSAHTYS